MSIVYIEKCSAYEEAGLKKSLNNIIEKNRELNELKKGSKILLKGNFVIKKSPEKAATTHPKFLKVLAQLLIKKGFKIVVGDSPGGLFTESYLKSVYRICGIVDEFAGVDAELNYNTDIKVIDNPDGLILNRVMITSYLEDVDFVINVPKLKTHQMMIYTGAIKNMFGAVPGERKAEYHFNTSDYDDFANILIDIYLATKPNFNIMDAVIGMEGQGPTAGNPVNLGFILASNDGFSLDMVALNIVKIKPSIVPVIKKAIERGLCTDSIEIIGESIDSVIYDGYKYPEECNLKSVGFINSRVGKKIVALIKPRPSIDYEKCIRCKDCVKACPAKIIKFNDDNKPEIEYKKCISCFCCHELCPVSAIKVKKPFILRLLIKITIKINDIKNRKHEK